MARSPRDFCRRLRARSKNRQRCCCRSARDVTSRAAHASCNFPMRILGIDPGLRLTGYGVIDYTPLRPALIDGGVIRLNESTSIASRLVELETELDLLLEEHKPEICAVEQLYSHYNHPRTAILMGQARGVVLLVATRR